jgi:hypothetical protein
VTSEVSSPGTASASDALVKVREGNSLVADVGALILWVVWCGVSRRVRGVKSSCWEGGAAVYVELAFFGFAAGQASVRMVADRWKLVCQRKGRDLD